MTNPESLAHLASEQGDIQFPLMPTDYDDDYANALAQVINWQNQTLAETHRMLTDIYKVVGPLLPLVGNLPQLPTGLVMPPMPGLPQRPKRR